MTLGQSLWVGTSTEKVLNPKFARLAMAGLLAPNSADPFDIRTGVLWSGNPTLITGTSGLSVSVATFQFVQTKGNSEGPYVGTNLTSTTITVPAAPALGSKRVDTVWVRQQDTGGIPADTVMAAQLSVTQGTPGSNPSKPLAGGTEGMPADAEEVGTITWDSTSTVAAATNAAQCTLATTCQWTATRGSAFPVRSASERPASPYSGMSVLRLDAGLRQETYDGTGWLTEVYVMDASVSTNPTGEFSITTGLSSIKFATIYNGNGGTVRVGNRRNITLARNSTGAGYSGGTLTGIAYAAETKVALSSDTFRVDWFAKGYA